MGIKGLKTRSAVLGNIKVGARKKVNTRHGPKVLPVKFNHFVVTTMEQDELGYLEDTPLMRRLMHEQLQMAIRENTEHIFEDRMVDGELQRVLVKSIQNVDDKTLQSQNDKLTRILVALPFDDPDENLVSSLAVYDREGVRCRGDGEAADWIDPRNGEVCKVSCPCKMLQFRLNPDDDPEDRQAHEKADRGMKPNEDNGFICKANGILRVRIAAARTLGGVHLFRTTSINSITQLLSAMEEVRRLTGGFLARIPLHLEVTPKRVAAGFGKKPQIVPVVNLTYKADEVEFLRTIVEQKALREQMREQIASGKVAELPAPGHENVHEQVAIAQEFFVAEPTPDEYIDVQPDPDQPPPPDDDDAPDKPVPESAPKKSVSKKLADAASEPPPEGAKAEPVTPEPEKAPEPSGGSEAPSAPSADDSQGSLGLDDEPPAEEPAAKQPETTEDSSKSDNSKGAGDAPQDNGERKLPGVILDKPKGANTRQATKKLRKQFFEAARSAEFTDAEIRDWINELWEAKSSAALKTWQVEAMLEALGA
jgi:hypothetical protein